MMGLTNGPGIDVRDAAPSNFLCSLLFYFRDRHGPFLIGA
jgi:hypothetical protein